MTKFTENLWSDLMQEHGPAIANASRPGPARGRRPRVIAGSTLALAGVGTALTLALSGTSAQPALAVTLEADGSVLVHVNVSQSTQPWVQSADRKLAAMGIDELIGLGPDSFKPGPATVSGPVSCTAMGGANTPPGPPVQVLLGTDGTQVIPANTTGGGGTVHLVSCTYFKTPTTDNTGVSVTGSPGPVTLPG
jgi:hypothetical protein